MKDRVSTKILNNGATRYGVYDEDGKLLRYEYIKLEDEPSTEGDFFNKVNMLPDYIPRLLGLKMSNPQVADALNVLANVGNLHVWERVQTYSEPVPEVPAGYTLGEVETDILIVTGTSSTRYIYFYKATSPTVDNNGNVSIPTTTTQSSYKVSVLGDGGKTLNGPYFFVLSSDTVGIAVSEVVYIPAGATMYCDSSYTKVYISKLQRVTGYPYTPAIPAGTTTDYLTSTDPNAYPKQSAGGGQDAYYTLGDVVSGSFYIGSFFAGSNSAVQYMVSDTPFVDESGSVDISNGTTVTFSNSLGDPGTESNAIAKVKALFAGKYVMRTNDPETDSSTMYYTLLPKNEVVYIPDDISVSVLTAITGSPNSMALSKYQPVIGHAAIPANTTITYLGKIGRPGLVLSSYRGTGAYGQGSPTTLHFEKLPNVIFISGYGDETTVLTSMQTCNIVVGTASFGDYATTHSVLCNVLVDGNTVKLWSTTGAYAQMNRAGEYFVAAFYL